MINVSMFMHDLRVIRSGFLITEIFTRTTKRSMRSREVFYEDVKYVISDNLFLIKVYSKRKYKIYKKPPQLQSQR